MADRNLLKSWFETGDYPTQEQFWYWIDACLFSGDVAIGDIVGLIEALQAKVDVTTYQAFEQGDRIAFDGNGYYDIAQGYLLEKVIVLYATAGTLMIGTTDGGEEVLPATDWTTEDYDPITIDKYAKLAPRRIYFTGLPAGTFIIFLKRKIKQ